MTMTLVKILAPLAVVFLLLWRRLNRRSGREKMQDKLMDFSRVSGNSLLYYYIEPRVPFKHEIYRNVDKTNHDFIFVNNGVHELLVTYHRPTRITTVAFSIRVDKNLAWLMTCHALKVLKDQGDTSAWVERHSTLYKVFEVSSLREHHRLPKFGEKPKEFQYAGTYTYSG